MHESLFQKIPIFRKNRIPRESISGPVKVKLVKGTIPEYIKFTITQKLAWRVFGKFVQKHTFKNAPKLEEDLAKAHILVRAKEYIAYAYFLTLISVIGFIALLAIFAIIGNIVLILLSIITLVIVPVVVYSLTLQKPASVAKTRGKLIDTELAPAMNFIAALASANVTPDMIFKELAQRTEYGEIAKESEWITRDTELLGKDILTALKVASKRSPSIKWTEFLQGVVTTSTSGGALKPYFISKSEEFEKEVRLQMKKNMETLSLFAETFVTVGVAFPLFLIIIMAIMALINRAMAPTTVMVLYVIVFIMLPVITGMFAYFIHSTSAEV